MRKGVKSKQNIINTPVDLSDIGKKHYKVQNFIKKESHYFKKYRKYERTIGEIKSEDIIVAHLKQSERILLKKILLYPEAVPFLFSLEGCPQKLFYYILLFELDYKTGTFYFNESVIKKFIDFCSLLNFVYKPSVIKQAIKNLSANNIVLSIKRMEYKMNPMITGSYSDYERTKLINEYSISLIHKRKDNNSIYPTLI
jgi:hypothetical protein